MRLLLVYHGGHSVKGYDVLARIVARLSAITPIRVAATPLELLGQTVGSGDLVYLLLLFKGGHYMEAVNTIRLRGGILLGKIPFYLTVKAAAKAVKKLDTCPAITINTHGADTVEAARLSELLSSITGRNVIVTSPARSTGNCRIVLSALPSNLCSKGECLNVAVAEDIDGLVEDIIRRLCSYCLKPLVEPNSIPSNNI